MPSRLEVSSAYTGPANYTCPVNPHIYDPVDRSQLSQIDILQGAPAYQESYFDNRVRSFKWPGYYMSGSSITSVITYFRSIKGETRYFHFQDIADMNLNWPTIAVSTADTDWKNARIIDIIPTYAKGGLLKYESVELLLQPEEP